MITLVAEHRGTPFGHLEQHPDGSIGVRLTSLGTAVKQQVLELPSHEEGISILRAVVMPDHVHIVLQVHRRLTRHLGKLIQGFKYGTTVAYLNDLNARHGGIHRIQSSRPSAAQRAAKAGEASGGNSASGGISAEEPPHTQRPAPLQPTSPLQPTPSLQPTSSPQPTMGSVGSGSSASISPAASASTPPAASLTSSPSPRLVPPLWSSGYHDRILSGRDQLSRMLHYVSDNPRRGWIKQQHRDLFYGKRLLSLPVSPDQARWLLREARSLGVMHELRDILTVEQRPTAAVPWQPFPWWQPGIHAVPAAQLRTSLKLKAMGNLFLLDEALLLPVRLSRRTPPGELQQTIRHLLLRCEHEGAVVITPAVSAPEEQVMHDVLHAGYKVIRLQASAMSDVYAPSEPLLDAIAQGQLLLLAPWPERPQSARPGKGLFELQNLLCRLLASRLPPQ